MQRLSHASAPVVLCTDATALALPPPVFALVPDGWNGGPLVPVANPTASWQTRSAGAVPQVDVNLWADAAVSLTGAKLYAAELHGFSFADVQATSVTAAVQAFLDLGTKTTHCDTVVKAKAYGTGGDSITIAFAAGASLGAGVLDESAYPAITYTYKTGVTTVADFEAAIAASTYLAVKTAGTPANVLASPADTFSAANLASGVDAKLTKATHGLFTGDGDALLTASVAFPTGTDGATSYYVIKDSANDFGLALSLTDAMSGTRVQFTSVGSGTIKLVKTATTQRVHWHSHGFLGDAGDGAISLDAQASYWTTVPHRPRVLAYGIAATFASGTGKVSGAVYPVVDA